jgi:phage tail tape-measure protein
LRHKGVTSDAADISGSITHIRLNQLLNQTVNLAKRQLAQEVPDVRMAELKALNNKNALRSANYNAITLTNK